MNMKLNDFARRCGISDRHARRLLSENASELSGHYEKRGNRGTLIDDYAAEYLRNLLRDPASFLPEEPEPMSEREAKLVFELAAVNAKLADAERRAGENAMAAGKMAMLEVSHALQEARIRDLSTENDSLKKEVSDVEKEALRAAVRLQERRDQLQEARDQLQEARDQIAETKRENEQLRNRKWYELLFKKRTE